MDSDVIEVLADAIAYTERRLPASWWERSRSAQIEFDVRDDARSILHNLSLKGYKLVRCQ